VYIMADGQQAVTNSANIVCTSEYYVSCNSRYWETRFANSFGREFEVDYPRARAYFGVHRAIRNDPYFSSKFDPELVGFSYPGTKFNIGSHFLNHSESVFSDRLNSNNYLPSDNYYTSQSFLYYKLSKRFVRWANTEPSRYLKSYSGIAYNTTQFTRPAQSACFIGAKLTDQERYLALADCLLLPIVSPGKRLCDMAPGSKLAIKCKKN
jgi:hypothetical protein